MINTKCLRPIAYENLIRIGRSNDGGYVIPEKIFSICDGLLSYGINKDWSFEKDFWKRSPKATIHCYDQTIHFLSLLKFSFKSVLLSVIYLVLLDRIRFLKAFNGLFVLPDYYSFFKGNRTYFKKRIWNVTQKNAITVDDTLNVISQAGSKNIFLKMDIETAEYTVLHSVLNTKMNIVGLAIEFHKIDHYSKEFNALINAFLDHYYIIHIHGNNYSRVIEGNNFSSTVEITFLHKKYVNGTVQKSNKNYPIAGLDQPNRFSKPDHQLRF